MVILICPWPTQQLYILSSLVPSPGFDTDFRIRIGRVFSQTSIKSITDRGIDHQYCSVQSEPDYIFQNNARQIVYIWLLVPKANFVSSADGKSSPETLIAMPNTKTPKFQYHSRLSS
jgi:hypothetical protein